MGLLGDYQDWQWKIDLGHGLTDTLDMYLSISGREQIKLNGKIVLEKYNYRFKRQYEFKLSDHSIITISVMSDFSKMGLPKITITSERDHQIKRTLGPPELIDEEKTPLTTDLKIAKYVAFGFIWALPLLTRGGAVPAGLAGAATVWALKIITNSSFSFTKKILYLGLLVLTEWISAVIVLTVIAVLLRR